MEIKVLKTYEIRDEQWEYIKDGFNVTFNRTTTVSQLKKYYYSTILGYSYHAVAINPEGRIIASNVITPMPYNHNLMLGYSGGTYILKDYRNDISLLRSMLTSLEHYCSGEDIIAFLAVPNKNSLTYFLRLAGYKQIDFLRYNVMPVKISALMNKKSLFLLDLCSVSFSWLLVSLNYCTSLIVNPKTPSLKYELSYDLSFYEKRFFQEYYTHIKKGDFECYYRISKERNINTAYILDFRDKGVRSLKALAKTTYYILSDKRSDVIMYIGHLRIKQFLFFRVPSKMEPQPLPLIYKLTAPRFTQHLEQMSIAGNWNFSLINFDAR